MEPELCFKALADPARVGVLRLLTLEGELCVCKLTHALHEILPRISRHLALLKETGLVLDERREQWVYYRINAALPAWFVEGLAVVVRGWSTRKRCSADQRTLTGELNRRGGARCA